MPGKWQQIASVNLNLSTGWTHSITTARRQYLLVGDGYASLGNTVDAMFLRINGVSTNTYRVAWTHSTEGAEDSESVGTFAGMHLFQAFDGAQHQFVCRIIRGNGYYVFRCDASRVYVPTGAVAMQSWYGRQTLADAPTSIHVLTDPGNAADRFTGQISLYGSDD